jgi:cytochrome c553
MKPMLEKLYEENMISLAAFLAALAPSIIKSSGLSAGLKP